MNFQGLLDNALGGQEEIVVRALMEKGILQRQVQCSSNHEEINMVLRNEGEAMRWRCLRCSNTKTIKIGSFFFESKLNLCKWVEVISYWLDGQALKDIKTSSLLAKHTAAEMLRHFRELCQSFLVKIHPLFGGPGESIIVKQLKGCGANCNVLFLECSTSSKGYLLHNTDNRYETNGTKEIPVAAGSTIYTNLDLKIPNGTITAAEDLYRSNYEESFTHALVWIRSKRGIPCKNTGPYLCEYNFRFSISNEDLENRFLNALALVYEDINM